MVTIEIRPDGCRGCKMCVDICPTKVLSFDEATMKAKVELAEDCVACLTCKYICPSGALTHDNYPAVKNFYRDVEFSRRMERFL
jgi:ferredoxin